jgi:hypothetical protein
MRWGISHWSFNVVYLREFEMIVCFIIPLQLKPSPLERVWVRRLANPKVNDIE